MNKSGIYKITNIINGKIYVGQAYDIEERWKVHRRVYKTENQIIYRAMRKYGLENFSFNIIEECPIEELDEKEIFYIDKYNTYIHAENSNGYNMTLGGQSTNGHKHSKESKDKMRKAHLGKTLSEETKLKMSEYRKGENNGFYGKTHTEESKKKMSESHKGKTLPVLENGKKFSDEHIKNLNKSKNKKVECEGLPFESIKDCANFYDESYQKMFNWLKGYTKMPIEWQEKDLKYI